MNLHNQRQVYGQTLVELGRENKKIVVLEADLGRSTMSHMFQEEFPDRYFEMGIAEADMVSFAAGLALTDKIAFVNSFAVFAAGRPYDQIRQGVCIAGLNVKIIGSSAGFSDFGDGSTHQSVEDIAIMRAIPNMTVIVPCDGIETKKVIRAITEYEGPVYVRLSRNDIPDVFPEDIKFEIGKPYVLKEGNDVVVFAIGIMVSKALEAAKQLEKEGISVKVVDVSTVKPLDERAIKDLIKGAKGIVTAEEHSYIGGLSSAIAFALKGCRIPFESVAVNDKFGQSARSYDELLNYYGLTVEEIIAKIKKTLNMNINEE
ncbi:putative transketolase C-terminal section [[Clostridium] cellulosi]|jgi:transketolase subunit B (EC 2.2.1.1)|uniref:Putative transketolase C-terminal section n=1 Tax=[Clostridium] cellulosi TaxID=29343 RepID=A0A078KR91_9FIRM|nr:MAG: transketolase family protein [[Clostridium] cellulosi]CDZ25032.1 putative transketolase C-terminal section [[Clostridium] cellulosi]